SGLFGLRTCRQPLTGKRTGTPCLNWHLKRCLGPCTGEISPAVYREAVEQVRRFLRGQSAQVEAALRRRMETASLQLDFERAAVLRDRLQSLQRAMSDQVVVSTRAVEQDVAAVASFEDTAVVAVLRVRHGRLIGQEEYPLQAVLQHSPAEMLEAFLTQHYSQAQWAPREVLLSDIEDPATWEETLSELRGSQVTVRRPERGAGRRLIELARQNAEAALARALQARQRREGATGAVEDLRDLAGTARLPERIEGYDISNLQGDHATASMVVFSMGLPDKQSYRRFRLRAPGPDDYAMLAEALRRRLQRLAEEDPKFLPAPDLILVDGGVGQVSAVRQVLEEAGRTDITLLGLAKQEEQVFLSGQDNPLPAQDHPAAWYLLQRVRDEAHRFARTYHLSLRDAAMTRSQLDAVPGVGPRRRQALLRAFPSLHEMARASVEELAAVPGMNRQVAQALKDHLAEKLG
ncbi:MAG: excinuclease ABC subunit UvrC, partial [candidate division WS1 bacterium]|nr:excinuclease ABC subunit UvrC [candidate division WS1 bacterium]